MKRKKTAGIIAGVLLTAVLMSGCQIGNKDIVVSNTLNQKQVFKIGGMACGLKEARVYLTNYQNIYGTAYGVDLWEHDFGDDSLVNYVKDVTLGALTKVICMDLLAESREMELTEEELGKVSEAAAEYYASLTEEETAYLDVTENDINEYYRHYALAQKLYNSLTDEVNEEVSDDEARVIEVMQIFVTDSADAMEVKARLDNGEDFATVANNYNELPSIQVTAARDDYPEAVEEVAFSLDNDQISGMITAENGYYFIKCLNKYNVELTEANKSNIVQKREEEAFDDEYNEFVSELSSKINKDLWSALTLNTEEEITTDSFFEVFQKYCGDI